jgi:hopanoid biosynthesis associated protein HpnK
MVNPRKTKIAPIQDTHHHDKQEGTAFKRLHSNRFVIINGDDFGYSPSVNQGIIQAHEQGILTSTSLMVTGEAFEEAVTLAKVHPNLAVGLHLVLGCGKSVLPPHQIPHLVDVRGDFPPNPVRAGLRYQFNRAAQRELYLEIRAQLEKFRLTGLPLSHVDGHLHHHSNPVVLRTLLEFAEEFSIKFIRLPYEELSFTLNSDRSYLFSKAIGAWIFSRLRHYGEGLLKARGINCAERVYGLLQTGRITEDYLLDLIPQIQANLVEIYAHPAMAIDGGLPHETINSGQIELEALLSKKVRDAFALHGFELTNYQGLF